MRVIILLLSFWSLFAIAFSKRSPSSTIFTSEGQQIKFEVLTEQREVIWGFDFLSDQRIIFSTREGSLEIFDPVMKSITEVKGVPKVWASGQGGLLDVRVHPKISNRIYMSYSEPIDDKASTSVAMATLKGDTLTDFKKIFTGNNLNDQGIHFGSRIEFDNKGFIFISLGERNQRERAQQLEYHNGKIIRLKEDGSIPQDNPFMKNKLARPEIWSFGHRNPQGLALDPQRGDLWSAEFGPLGGDELNLIKPGLNYGWPIITYGREYSGQPIGDTHHDGMEQPIAYWVPSISPSGMAFYNANAFPKWKGNIFLGNLGSTHLRRLVMSNRKVVKQEELLKDQGLRIRNVRTGPDGFLYLSTDNGFIARLIPVK